MTLIIISNNHSNMYAKFLSALISNICVLKSLSRIFYILYAVYIGEPLEWVQGYKKTIEISRYINVIVLLDSYILSPYNMPFFFYIVQ